MTQERRPRSIYGALSGSNAQRCAPDSADETEHLLSSPKNAARLRSAIKGATSMSFVKPCPHCGSDLINTSLDEDHDLVWCFEAFCKCGASMSLSEDAPQTSIAEDARRISGPLDVIAKWNERAPQNDLLTAHVQKMQAIACYYLTSRLSANEFINKIIYMLDGPEQREAMAEGDLANWRGEK